MIENSKTAILLFSRTAAEESKIKVFNPKIGKKGNRLIAKRLIRQSISISRESGLQVFTCFNEQQIGDSFGERLANAFESIFEKGFQKVISIGNDCPQLSTATLNKANHLLNNKNIVFGPAIDGGVYLIGLNKNAYRRENFIDLDWEKSSLQKSLIDYAQLHSDSLSWLVKLGDIDSFEDFIFFINTLLDSNKLKRYFLSILATLAFKKFLFSFNILQRFHLNQTTLRAPPF